MIWPCVISISYELNIDLFRKSVTDDNSWLTVACHSEGADTKAKPSTTYKYKYKDSNVASLVKAGIFSL